MALEQKVGVKSLAIPSIWSNMHSADYLRALGSFCATFLVALLVGTTAQAQDIKPQPIPIPIPGEPSATPPSTAPAEDEKPTISSTDKSQKKLTVSILYLKQDRSKEALPLSFLDLPQPDDGIAGAKLGIADNNTTGSFLNQTFKLDVLEGNVDDLIKGATAKVAAGDHFIIADLDPDQLLKLSAAMSGKPALIFNVGAPDNRLREEDCRANVMHVAPSRSQLTDALAQYLVWKKWRNWLLVSGPLPEDKLLADAYKKSAKKFGANIVEERMFNQPRGSRRADGGYSQIQQQIPQFLQGAKDHDIVIVADAGDLFADYFPYRTWEPRPVAGSAGLVASSWSPSLEFWGGTQFQNRFVKLNNRYMKPVDYDAWVATRVVGEAVTRKQTGDFKTLEGFIRSPNFDVAAFKGVPVSFRSWNGQLRQPILITTRKLVVSASPQPGFLHQFSVLDTLGVDKPETKCKAYTQ
jgi:ABC transporter substrate binding protein (PQQ-dependent alcohol dehydrogenase system)